MLFNAVSDVSWQREREYIITSNETEAAHPSDIQLWMYIDTPSVFTLTHTAQLPITSNNEKIMIVKIPIWILRFYDLTYSKRSKSFKNLNDHSGLVRSYDSNNPKWPLFFVIFFNLTEDLVGPKWKIKSQ